MKLIENIIITIKKESNIIKDEETLKTFLGEEFIGYKGIDAIDKLMKERHGYIKDAFYRKGIDNIALVWGDNKKGLQHILKRRKELKQPIATLLKNLVDVIEKGKITIEDNKIKIYHKRKNVIIGLNYDGYELTFLLSAFYDYDYKNNIRK